MGIEFRLPKANEIEARIGILKKNGLTLLLYQDARVGMTILDETVGAENWQRKHELINGNLFCSVGININYDKPEKEPFYVWKQDVGTESNTEKEKGQASDSFKRAVVNWGICRCLYSAPFIWIAEGDARITMDDNKRLKCNDRFNVSHIAYNEENEISELVIVNASTGDIVYTLGGVPAVKLADVKTVQTIKDLVVKTSSNEAGMLSFFSVSSIEEMTLPQARRCIQMLESKLL